MYLLLTPHEPFPREIASLMNVSSIRYRAIKIPLKKAISPDGGY